MKRATSSTDQELLKILKEMEALQAQYPEELLSSRRASFLEQVEQSTVARKVEQLSSQDYKVIDHLRNLGSVPVEYPPRLLAARRSTFARRIAWLNFASAVTAAWLSIQKRIPIPAIHGSPPTRRAISTSLLAASLSLAVFMGYLFYESQNLPASFMHPQTGTVQSGRIVTASSRAVSITCKPGAKPPLCLAGEYKQDTDQALAYQGNGSARPAVAKDTMSSGGGVYKAAYVNDGLYGPGASWISNSRNSWIKIDLGKATMINTVTFGRDRLGKLNGHNPGQFVVSLALTDNVYANGNNSKDNKEYQPVFNSKLAGFSGMISDSETVVAQFAPRDARYIKITFENKGTAIDEVEAFMKQSPLASSLSSGASHDRNKDKDNTTTTNSSGSQASGPISPPISITSSPVIPATSIPTETFIPNDTATPIPTATDIPTNTPVPTSTAVPTSTPAPVNTSTPVPSDTPVPPPTSTPVPLDTATSVSADLGLPTSVSPQNDYFDYLTVVPPNP
jgi:hypothetical protein